jgi:hypothetical protein
VSAAYHPPSASWCDGRGAPLHAASCTERGDQRTAISLIAVLPRRYGSLSCIHFWKSRTAGIQRRSCVTPPSVCHFGISPWATASAMIRRVSRAGRAAWRWRGEPAMYAATKRSIGLPRATDRRISVCCPTSHSAAEREAWVPSVRRPWASLATASTRSIQRSHRIDVPGDGNATDRKVPSGRRRRVCSRSRRWASSTSVTASSTRSRHRGSCGSARSGRGSPGLAASHAPRQCGQWHRMSGESGSTSSAGHPFVKMPSMS